MKMPSLLFSSLLIVVLAGCNTKDAAVDQKTKDNGTAADTTSTATTDATINSSVKAKLAADDAVSAAAIDASTQKKVVTLTGTVESQAIKDRAVMMTRQMDGVSGVVDQMMIGGPGCCPHTGQNMMKKQKGMGMEHGTPR